MSPTAVRPPAVVVTGPPASGKSTVAAAVARHLGATLIDLDAVTEPLVDIIGSLINVDDLDDPRLAALTRDARYECITRIAEENLRAGNAVVLVAPFTQERQNLRAWESLSQRLHVAGGGTVTMVWLQLDAQSVLQRLRHRLAPRDQAKLEDEGRFLARLDLGPPVGPHVAIDAVHEVDEVIRSVVTALRSEVCHRWHNDA
jgi:predicted kinase